MSNQGKMSLGVEDFEHKLNFENFTNIEKGFTTFQFNAKYPSDKFLVFEESNILHFIKSVNKTVGGEIQKGGFNDTEEINNLIEKAKSDLLSLSRVRINDGEGNMRYVYVKERVAEEFNKGQENDIEKSHVTDAFSYGQNSFKFSKSGKDIKEKIMTIKDEIEDENSLLEKEISELQDKFTTQPTEKPYLWGARERVKNVPYKVFNWNQTYFSNSNSGDSYGAVKMEAPDSSGNSIQPCGSQEEADVNSKYNSCVGKWIDNCAEICTLEMYENNIDEKKSYDLTPDQMLALKF